MNDTIYRCSKPVLEHTPKNLLAILKPSVRDARVRRIDPEVLLHARLAPDMHSLARQVHIATDHARCCWATAIS